MMVVNAHCTTCGVNTRQECPINHGLHIILTLITSGLWAFVYGYKLVAGGSDAVCSVCGTTNMKP